MNIQRIGTTLLVSLLGLSIGCIRSKQYRPVGTLTPLSVPPTPDGTAPSSIAVKSNPALPVGTRCLSDGNVTPGALTPARNDYKDSGPCIAFVEYDAKGRSYPGNQIGSALELVRKAIQDDPDHQPIIVGFVHGWKHNASPGNIGPTRVSTRPPEDSNIQGLEHVLNYLYRCSYADPNINSPCLLKQRQDLRGTGVKGHVVVGIYFGWYGADISPFWPVAEQISVYSRGDEAENVGHAGALSNDLQQLSKMAHPFPKPEHEPLFVLVGHSFGARLLERAIKTPLEARILEQIQDSAAPTFADLVLYINSAAPAIDGIDMLGFLADHKVQYKGSGGAKPLLAAITTPADAATGIGFTIEMSPSSWLHGGQVKVQGFDPASGTLFSRDEDQPTLWRNTLGHLQEFQSHSVNPVPGSSQSTCQGAMPGSFFYWVPGHCFQVVPATPMAGQPFRWNGTPYWVVSTDQTIIPDHGTIFTNRFLRFVGHVLPTESDKAIVTGQ